jgi:hypothetical protein
MVPIFVVLTRRLCVTTIRQHFSMPCRWLVGWVFRCWYTHNTHTTNTPALVWTPYLMHRCVISTMFGSCFSFFKKTFSFLNNFLICFLLLLLFCITKIKCFFFTFVFLFIWMKVWSLEKEDTPHSFSSRVFLQYYISFIFSYFLLFIWFLLFCKFFFF